MTMSRIKQFVVARLIYLWTKVIVYALAICLVMGLSFLVTGNFTFLAYSERIFWAGLIVIIIGGTVALALLVQGTVFPYNIRRPEDAKKFVEKMPEERAKADNRLDVGLQLWLIGLFCVGVSALVQITLT